MTKCMFTYKLTAKLTFLWVSIKFMGKTTEDSFY